MSTITVEMNEVIACPVGQAFERATDLDHYEDWMPRSGVFRSSRQTSAGPMAAGTTFIDRGRMGTFAGDVVEFAPPSRVVYRERLRWLGRPALEARIRYEFRAIAGRYSRPPRRRVRAARLLPDHAADGEDDRPRGAQADARRSQESTRGGAGPGPQDGGLSGEPPRRPRRRFASLMPFEHGHAPSWVERRHASDQGDRSCRRSTSSGSSWS